MKSDLIEDPVLKQRYTFERTTSMDDPSREVMQVECWVDPGGGVIPHIHPTFEERFHVLEGEVHFLVGRKWIATPAGEAAVVPAGTRHSYKNKGSVQARFIAEADPPLEGLEGFLTDAAALARAGKFAMAGVPKNPSGALAAAVMAKHYRADTLLLNPPPFLQKLIGDPLARFAEKRGYRAGHFAEQFGV
jgi:quercetin dioxygenase-like cupin family protein